MSPPQSLVRNTPVEGILHRMEGGKGRGGGSGDPLLRWEVSASGRSDVLVYCRSNACDFRTKLDNNTERVDAVQTVYSATVPPTLL